MVIFTTGGNTVEIKTTVAVGDNKLLPSAKPNTHQGSRFFGSYKENNLIIWPELCNCAKGQTNSGKIVSLTEIMIYMDLCGS